MDLKSAFTAQFHTNPTVIGRAPGRVNLLGEHVDYNDGIVLPAAIDRAVRVAAAPIAEGLVSVAALDLGEQITFRLAELEARCDIEGQPLPPWALYPAGVAASLLEEGLTVSGMQAVYTSDVPIGAGLSSSAAVEVAFAVTWQALGGWRVDALRLAQLCQGAENRYVGVNCGLMDQFASACGVAGNALLFDTRSLAYETVPLPPGSAIVIADSGVRRTLATSAYNERRAACQQAVALLQRFKPEMTSLRDISAVEFAAYGDYLPEEVRRRAEHVVKEIDRVQQAAVALRLQDTKTFGALMFASHKSLRDLYQVSCPELDALVEIARQLPGCIGARLTGAGFGGCTVNLVQAAQAQGFIQGLMTAYEQRTGRQAQVYLCQASQGAQAEWVTAP